MDQSRTVAEQQTGSVAWRTAATTTASCLRQEQAGEADHRPILKQTPNASVIQEANVSMSDSATSTSISSRPPGSVGVSFSGEQVSSSRSDQ